MMLSENKPLRNTSRTDGAVKLLKLNVASRWTAGASQTMILSFNTETGTQTFTVEGANVCFFILRD